MKTNKFADLIRKGLTLKSLMTLSESEINRLHKLYEGKKDKCSKCGKEKCECEQSKKKVETKEQTPPGVTKQKVSYDKYTVNPGAEMAVGDMIVKNKGGKTELTAKSQQEGEMKEESKAKNPWAICHAQVGPKKSKKFERCVRAVKASMDENKLPFDRILENKILSLLEKHTNPSMKKGDLMNLIGKKKMKLPIGKLGSIGISEEEETKTKPKTKPTTKPDTKPKPHDPFRPKPHQQPAPKAKKETKEAVMDAPVKEPKKTPTVKPGEKPTTRPKPLDPFRPKPHQQPAPKAKKRIPEWLSFNNLGIKFKK